MARVPDRDRLILLNLIEGIGSLRLRRLLDAFGGLDGVWSASAEQLSRVRSLTPAIAQRIVEGRSRTDLVDRELELAKAGGARIVTQADAEFPEPLRQIPDPPLAFYLRGTWTPDDRIAVAIVGSRRASVYGQEIAGRLATDLAARGVTVVSGLARGIDAAAHRGALRAGGRTIAVLGNGLDIVYPSEHQSLADEVAAQGALISEYPMGMGPIAGNFPRRNRLVSGLSLGVVVVEAATRSGALITADCALEQGREVFAVPGKVDSTTSHGTHNLLKQGAKLVTSVEDIVDELRLVPEADAVGEDEQALIDRDVKTLAARMAKWK